MNPPDDDAEDGAKERRPSDEHQRAALKTIVANAVADCGGPVLMARRTRVSAGQLCISYAEHMPDRHVGLDVALDIDLTRIRVGQEPPIHRAIGLLLEEARRGFRPAVAVPPSLDDFRRVHADAHALANALLDALADGLVTQRERKAVLREIADMRSELSALESRLFAGMTP